MTLREVMDAEDGGAPLPQEGEKAPEREALAQWLVALAKWSPTRREKYERIASLLREPKDTTLALLEKALAGGHSTPRFTDEQVAEEMFRGENDDDCPGMRAPDAVALRKQSALWKVQEVRAAKSRLAGGSVEQTPEPDCPPMVALTDSLAKHRVKKPKENQT